MSRTHAKPKRRKVLEALRPQLARIKVPSVKQVGPALERLRQAVTPKPKDRVETVHPPAETPSAPPVVPPKVVERPESKPVQGPSQTWLRPKRVQLNDGRIEISVPWQLGVAIGLGLILVVLIVFRLGQIDQKARFAGAQQPVRTSAPSPTPDGDTTAAGSDGTQAGPVGSGSDSGTPPPASTGDHVIVLAHYPVRTHLEPVRSYFASKGVETSILAVSVLRQYFSERGLNTAVLPDDDGFMLVTSGLYENPNNSDSDGYAMKQKIVRFGAQYKAPTGYETFAPNYFSDAYGMKFE
jgi:hypothetical protein